MEGVEVKDERHGLTVYILAHGRPEYTVLTVRSVLEQEVSGGFRFIISDNTGDDSVRLALDAAGLKEGTAGRSTKLEYRQRGPEWLLNHYQCILDEVLLTDARYVVMFHNDDLMLPGMLQKELDVLQKGHYGACGCDSWQMDADGKRQNRTLQGYYVNPGPDVEAHGALGVYRASSAWHPDPPLGTFPSYMYDLLLMGDVPVPVERGKHCDEIWMANIAEKTGAVFSIGQPFMLYRRYGGQDSHIPSVRSAYLWNQEYAKVAKSVEDWRGIRKHRVYVMLQYTMQMRHHTPSPRQLRIYRRSMLLRDRLASVGGAVGDCFMPPIARAYRALMPKDLRKVLWRVRHPILARRWDNKNKRRMEVALG